MSEVETPSKEGRAAAANAWTDEVRYEFVLRVMHQLLEGKRLDWSRIEMEGRTRKAMQGQWTKILKDISNLDGLVAKGEEDGNGTPAAKKGPKTPRTSTPRKNGAKKSASKVKDEDEGSDVEDTPSKTPKKRGGADVLKSPSKSPKKVKKEEPADEPDEDDTNQSQPDEDEVSTV